MKLAVLFLFAALVLSLPTANTVLADDEDTGYEADNLTIQVGADASDLSFTWLTSGEITPELVVWEKKNTNGQGDFHAGHRADRRSSDEMTEESIPRFARFYTVEMEELISEESSGDGGGPGGGPSMSSESDSDDSTDTEEEESTVYSCKVSIKNL